MLLRKNVAGQIVYFHTIGSQTVTAFRNIDGGSRVSCTGTVVEDSEGTYHLVTSAADTNGNFISYTFKALGAVGDTIQAETIGMIWDEPLTSHSTAGTTGKALTDAANAVAPNTLALAVWNTLTSALTAVGSIGKLLNDRVDVAVSTRLAEADYTGSPTGDIALIKAKTDLLPGQPAAVSDIPTADAVADALLDRTAGVETSWTLRQTLRVMLAALAGKVSGAATSSVVIRNVGDDKNRISATVDTDGNRTAVTYDKT